MMRRKRLKPIEQFNMYMRRSIEDVAFQTHRTRILKREIVALVADARRGWGFTDEQVKVIVAVLWERYKDGV